MKDLITSTLMLLVLTLALGLVYPLAVWAVGQTIFPHQSNGSLIYRNGKIIGSELIGQNFDGAGYFHGRPSAAGNGYDAGASGGSNLGPTSRKLLERIQQDVAALQTESPSARIPADLVTASASGLDPHITPLAAAWQIPRVARARGLSETEVRALVTQFTEGRQLGVLGEPRVNVLLLNLALDKAQTTAK